MDNHDIIKKLKSLEEETVKLRKELEKDMIPEDQQVIGTFDGEFMVTEDGKKYQVPPNYASKSMLVEGDTLRLIEEGPQNMFKHIDKVERKEIEGTLIQEDDGTWVAVSDLGKFKILPASIKHFEVDIGDRITMYIPEKHSVIGAQWGAMSGVVEDQDKPSESEGKPLETTQSEPMVQGSTSPKVQDIQPEQQAQPQEQSQPAVPETTAPIQPLAQPIKPEAQPSQPQPSQEASQEDLELI